jgi:hypothetical protein
MDLNDFAALDALNESDNTLVNSNGTEGMQMDFSFLYTRSV